MTQKVDFDFSEFNEECKRAEQAPFPLQKVTIDIQDDEHFKLSIQNWQKHLERWWQEQNKSRQSAP